MNDQDNRMRLLSDRRAVQEPPEPVEDFGDRGRVGGEVKAVFGRVVDKGAGGDLELRFQLVGHIGRRAEYRAGGRDAVDGEVNPGLVEGSHRTAAVLGLVKLAWRGPFTRFEGYVEAAVPFDIDPPAGRYAWQDRYE